jgi:hypothetical protein
VVVGVEEDVRELDLLDDSLETTCTILAKWDRWFARGCWN